MSNEADNSKKRSFWEKAHIVITAILTVVAATSQIHLSNLDGDLKKQDILLKDQDAKIRASEEQRKQHESDAQLTFKLYEEVKSALLAEKNPEKQQLIALKLVEEMASEPFKTRLITVIRDATPLAGVKEKASTAAYVSESKALEVRPAEPPAKAVATANRASVWSNWDFDFFWCEDSGDKGKQEAYEALAIKDSGASGRWRVRMLPNSINAQSGYGISGYQVRINPNERDVGNKLKSSLASASTSNRDYVIREVKNPTPYYVSVFFFPP